MSELPSGAGLVIVCGLPGAGKTTHAIQVERRLHAVRLCAVEWMEALKINLWDSEARQRIERIQWTLAQQFLCRGGNVVIEWGTWARTERDALRIGARNLGAAVELHVLDGPPELLLERIHRRNAETPPITLDDMQKWSRQFEKTFCGRTSAL